MRKRGNGEGSIYQRLDGRWTASVTCGRQPNGKPKRKYLYGNSRKEVAEKLASAQVKNNQGIPLGDDRQKLSDFLGTWLIDVIKPSKSWRTYSSYKGLVERHIVPELGRVVLTKLTPQQVQTFLNRKSESGLSSRTVQYIRTVLGAALSQAVNWELVSRNVARLTSTVSSSPKDEIRPYTEEESAEFFRAAADDRLAALYVLAITTGARQGELLGLQWSSVDFDQKKLVIKHTLLKKEKEFILTSPKTDRSKRTIHLSKVALDALTRHQEIQTQDKQLAGEDWTGNDLNLIFTTSIGTPIDRSNLRRRFHKTLADAKLRPIRFHDLRHTAATFLISKGVAPRTVMEILGHSTIRVTMDIYTHVLEEQQLAAASKMDEAFGPPNK